MIKSGDGGAGQYLAPKKRHVRGTGMVRLGRAVLRSGGTSTRMLQRRLGTRGAYLVGLVSDPKDKGADALLTLGPRFRKGVG